MEVSGQLHAPAALPAGKEPPVPMDRRLGAPQSRSGRRGEEYSNLYERNIYVSSSIAVFETVK
jgi:hypothetical protein